MSIIKAVRDYLAGCPYLSDFTNNININYLDEQTEQYSVSDVPIDPVVREYMDESRDKQFAFAITSREFYVKDNTILSGNSELYENISDWLEAQSDAGIFPTLSTTKTAYNIRTVSSGYIINNDLGTAVYQIQCRMEYHQA